jgi:hypothetical protein
LEYPSRYFDADPPGRLEDHPLRRVPAHISPVAQSDLGLARTTRANLLVVGADPQVSAAVSFLAPDLTPGGTIRRWDGRLLFPRAPVQGPAVVIRDVDTLTPREQNSLLEWLESEARPQQLVSTSSAALLPLVETGSFDAGLYYRLNAILVDLFV